VIDYGVAPGGVFSMFAIVAASGKQFRVTEGDRILVDLIAEEVGKTVRLDSVLLLGGGDSPLVGKPFVPGAAVEALVLGHRAGDKVVVFKYKAKSRYRRKYGHRARLTELKISAIHQPGSGERELAQGAPVGETAAPAGASTARRRRGKARQDKE
jgi:large subunit ribosomal protein L21